GHSALCVTSDAYPKGRCYDFGVTDAPDPAAMVLGTLRGEKQFIAVAVDLDVLVKTFSEQERDIFRQTIPLDDAHASTLAKSLEDSVEHGDRYAYDPAMDNCTTELRDRLDAALDKKLSAPGPGTRSSAMSYREIVEEPFSGRILEETVLALLVGPVADRHPTPYEALFLPFDLRDAIEARTGAKAEQVHKRNRGVELRTSTNVGRGTLVLIGLFLSAIVWAGARKKEPSFTRAVRGVGIVLGLVALGGDAFAIVATYPWLAHNWVLVLLWPTDVALGWLPADKLTLYLKTRVGVLLVVGLASLVHLVGQPVVAVALFAALPLGTVYRKTRAR
ncbi:MAG: DUF4105 domain-containing protein, partial [Polyangiaceae bacterium]